MIDVVAWVAAVILAFVVGRRHGVIAERKAQRGRRPYLEVVRPAR